MVRPPWFARLLARMPARKATVALANKMARIAWALLTKQTTYRAPLPSTHATGLRTATA